MCLRNALGCVTAAKLVKKTQKKTSKKPTWFLHGFYMVSTWFLHGFYMGEVTRVKPCVLLQKMTNLHGFYTVVTRVKLHGFYMGVIFIFFLKFSDFFEISR